MRGWNVPLRAGHDPESPPHSACIWGAMESPRSCSVHPMHPETQTQLCMACKRSVCHKTKHRCQITKEQVEERGPITLGAELAEVTEEILATCAMMLLDVAASDACDCDCLRFSSATRWICFLFSNECCLRAASFTKALPPHTLQRMTAIPRLYASDADSVRVIRRILGAQVCLARSMET